MLRLRLTLRRIWSRMSARQGLRERRGAVTAPADNASRACTQPQLHTKSAEATPTLLTSTSSVSVTPRRVTTHVPCCVHPTTCAFMYASSVLQYACTMALACSCSPPPPCLSPRCFILMRSLQQSKSNNALGRARAAMQCAHFIKSMPSCRSPCTSNSCALFAVCGVAMSCARTSFSCCSYLRGGQHMRISD